MKNLLIIVVSVFTLMSCAEPDPKTQLEQLKKQKSDIEQQISNLQQAIAQNDSSGNKMLTEVISAPLTASIFKTYIEVQGFIDAEESVSLSTQLPGTITKINVKIGNKVSKGQVLAETDVRVIQQQLLDVQTNLDLANQAFLKQESLWNQKIGSEMQYLTAKTTKESLERKVAVLQEQLSMSKIISPIDGTVDGIDLKIGQAVAPGRGVVNVVNFSNLKVKADVAESYAAKVKNGDEAVIVFPDIHDTLISTVHYASRAIDNLTRTFAVEVYIQSKEEYHPNMVAKLRINDYRSKAPQISVPVKYIQKTSTQNYVMIVKDGKALKQMVTLGREYQGNAEVLDGLKVGDLLITKGYDLVNDGEEIQLKK